MCDGAINHTKPTAKLLFFFKTCKRLRDFFENNCFSYVMQHKTRFSLAQTKKNEYLCELFYVWYVFWDMRSKVNN